jgi:AcrR family transcriptional regulator
MSGKRRAPATSPELREELAEEAARLMVEHGIEDFSLAKRKAADRFGARFAGALPSNAQIHERLVERQRIFEADARDGRVATLRTLAARVLLLLEPFRPKLVGAVLAGTATANSAIEVHVFSDSPEDVAGALESHGLRPRNHQRRYRFGREMTELIPGFALVLDGEQIEVMVFPERGSNHAPLSPIDGKPMRRASRSAVLALLAPP